MTNNIVWEAFEKKRLPHWSNYDFGKREVKISDKSRIDLVLWDKKQGLDDFKKLDETLMTEKKFHFVEIKNVTLISESQKNLALFPDSVTTRGQKHLEELMTLVDLGHTAEIFYLVQRQDCDIFSPADDIDPEYGRLLREAQKKGVKITACACKFSKDGIEILPKFLEISLPKL